MNTTYSAKILKVRRGGKKSFNFKVAGTLDGLIDLATDRGTSLLTISEAHKLASALENSIADVLANCLYGRDALLK